MRTACARLGELPQDRDILVINLNLINAIHFVVENGCKWHALPTRFGNWHTIYTRMNRWPKAGDAPEGRALLHSIQGAPPLPVSCHLLTDCAYEGNETRQLAFGPGFLPVVPPHLQSLREARSGVHPLHVFRAHRGSTA
jgi:hypothetical protein